MRVGRFIKRLISPEPDPADDADQTAGTAAFDAGGEGPTSFLQVEPEIVSAAARETGIEPLGEAVTAVRKVVPESAKEPEPSEEPEPEQEAVVSQEPEPELVSESEPEPKSEPESDSAPVPDPNRLFATDSELREAGIDLIELGVSDAADEDFENEPEVPEPEPEPALDEEPAASIEDETLDSGQPELSVDDNLP
ncbi:MAG: hypothetical protein V3T49_03930, partial [Dehalococcoidia bacterium]